MSNDVQKQYDRLDDVASILQRMKEVYAIPDRHTWYVATTEFFRAKMTDGSSVQEHGVKMLSLVEKLEDLKARLENDMYIDATIKKSAPSVLIGEASTSKAKGKRVGSWKRKKGKAKVKTVVIAKEAKSAPVAPVGMGKGMKRMGTQQQSRANDICAHYREKGHWKRNYPNLSSDQGMFVVEVNMVTNFASWVLDTGCGAHICNDLQVLQKSRKLSKDEVVLRLGDGKAVAAEAVGIINLVTSVDLNTQARGGFSHFITFTDDHSWYGYVYLIRYKFEAFVTFKNSGFKLRTKLVAKVKPFGQTELNGVAERRNRTLLDMIQSMMSFTELPLSFWDYALEMAAKLLNIEQSKTVAQTPYQTWHGKPASYKYLRVWNSPAYVKRLVRDKLDSRSSLCRFIGYPKKTTGYYFYDPSEQKGHRMCLLFPDNVPILRKLARVPQPPERYGFLGVTDQLDNNPKTYGEAMSDIDSEKWLEAMKSEMDSMSSN
ncbi:UNVERIFIED_CONTAM: hypothetical protein Sradi_6439900 [Sesamum radiatum]|uniref:Uncharacterized protein n=1 Tax=Sesamum radiatum TaxID=300843 RepID=A0AAW2K6D0_SESRA